ncbi:hypothetical protein EXU48_09755 [Occultella glacieicola]|uniref:Uncharacterized protein n=1 Tax=Occultella glacieicola TaxID=2518684 RepID=A0ABY2E4U3_9MICO|nr:hypothetical protein [Occultella glacieicola]TDE95040.1 hypothetical protein EXU48_09755 [Occultella glacieicola]
MGQSPESADGALFAEAGLAGDGADAGLAGDGADTGLATGDGADTGLATGDGAETGLAGEGAETGEATGEGAETELIAVTAETALPGSTVAGSVVAGVVVAGVGSTAEVADTAEVTWVVLGWVRSTVGACVKVSAEAATAPPATATTPRVPVTIHAVRLFMMFSLVSGPRAGRVGSLADIDKNSERR